MEGGGGVGGGPWMERCQEITVNALLSIYEVECVCAWGTGVCRNVYVLEVGKGRAGCGSNEAASWTSPVPSHLLRVIRG